MPADANNLQPHQVDALRETIAVAQANRSQPGVRAAEQQQAGQQRAGGAGSSSSSSSSMALGRQSGSQQWLQDYTDMSTVSG
jgi:hypothetical protein